MVMTNVSMKKRNKGRRKIQLKNIEDSNSRQVTFSKRRIGLFKKASELCLLTGAQIAILIHSPSDRLYTFGHPNADLLVDRYLMNDKTEIPPPPLPVSVGHFNEHYLEVSRAVEMEKKRIPVRSGNLAWYEESVDGMTVEELEEYLCSLETLKKKVLTRAYDLMMMKNVVPDTKALDIVRKAEESFEMMEELDIVDECGALFETETSTSVDAVTNFNSGSGTLFEMMEDWNNNTHQRRINGYSSNF